MICYQCDGADCLQPLEQIERVECKTGIIIASTTSPTAATVISPKHIPNMLSINNNIKLTNLNKESQIADTARNPMIFEVTADTATSDNKEKYAEKSDETENSSTTDATEGMLIFLLNK